MADKTSKDTPPDRLSLDPRSPHFDESLLRRGVGIRFNGIEKTNVEEYSVTEGWIKVAAGKSRDRFGNPPEEVTNLLGLMRIKLYLKRLHCFEAALLY